jgi:hypothetical protein
MKNRKLKKLKISIDNQHAKASLSEKEYLEVVFCFLSNIEI